jgi:phage recombination protein Bet
MANEVVQAAAQKKSILATMAAKFSVDPENMLSALKSVAFKQGEGKVISNEQMVALLIVANQYGLNPFTKEIYAFPDKNGGIVPVVGIDGWNRIATSHPQYDGEMTEYSDTIDQPDGGKPCPEWAKITIYRKDRTHPTVHTEYLDECYRNSTSRPGPWQTHTKRMLTHKVRIQGYRAAFGFVGIFEEDEAERIVSSVEAEVLTSTTKKPATMHLPTKKVVAPVAPVIESTPAPAEAQQPTGGPDPKEAFLINVEAILDEMGFATTQDRTVFVTAFLKPFKVSSFEELTVDVSATALAELTKRYNAQVAK